MPVQPVMLRIANERHLGDWTNVPGRAHRSELGVVAQIPNVFPANYPGGSFNAFRPTPIEDATGGVIAGAAGIGIAYGSQYIGGTVGAIGTIGGIGLAGFGIYKILDALWPGAKVGGPTRSDDKPPEGQTEQDVVNFSGAVTRPKRGESVVCDDSWRAVYGALQSYQYEYDIFNRSKRDLTAYVIFRSASFERGISPAVLGPLTMLKMLSEGKVETMETRTTEEVKAGHSLHIPGRQPIRMPLIPPYTVDVVATLVVKTHPYGAERMLDTTYFEVRTA